MKGPSSLRGNQGQAPFKYNLDRFHFFLSNSFNHVNE